MLAKSKYVLSVVLVLTWISATVIAEPPDRIFTTEGKVASVKVQTPDVEKDAIAGVVTVEGNPTPIHVKTTTSICVGDTSDLVLRSIGSIKPGQQIEVVGKVQNSVVIATQIIIRTDPGKK